MSSPSTTPRRNPRRTTPKRSPLQERSSSQKNEAAARLHKDSRQELSDAEIFSSTPFPTKPQHVLLPSTIRKQRSRHNAENELPGFLLNRAVPEASSSSSNLSMSGQDGRKSRKAPNLQLKRSVTALRDMYEAQAESSRPSSAVTSPVLRPTTANSRLRSASSSEGLAGRSAWELLGLPKVSSDDLAILPTLTEDDIQQINSETSFASRMKFQEETSSPNFRTFGSSSPRFPIYEDVMTSSDPVEGSSGSEDQLVGTSSPNFVQIQDSSMVMTDPTPPSLGSGEEESSPNLVKLGTTSPKRSSSPTPSQMSTGSRKRKRSEIEGASTAGRTPLTVAFGHRRVHSSPPVQMVQTSSNASLQSDLRVLPSSPPEVASPQSQATTSPIIRIHGGRFSTDSSSVVSAHTNLQSVLSSSPAPPVQRPIVRAPDVNQFEILYMQKRKLSGPSNIMTGSKPRLSPVPSEADLVAQQLALDEVEIIKRQQRTASRAASRTSIFTEELNEDLDIDSFAPVQTCLSHDDPNQSQVHMISEADRHEAIDGLSALPREHSSFAAALSQARASFYGSSSSSNSLSRLDSLRSSLDSRLQNTRSFAHGRNDSFRSYRPGSSSSYVSANGMPTWARRYYSGFYQDSFNYLYQSSSNLSYQVKQIAPPPRRSSLLAPSRSYRGASARSSFEPSSRQSLSQSIRASLRQFMPTMLHPIPRPKVDIRRSHTTAGLGPLVSHPVRPQSLVLSRTPSSYRNARALRHVSLPLSAADPRWHWKGIIITPEMVQSHSRMPSQDHQRGHPLSEPPYGPTGTQYKGSQVPLSRLLTPRLHRDRRLHTGSTDSAGFGAPYNTKPKWQPGQNYDDERGRPSWFKVDLRNVQVLCFISGFLFPFTWFVGAFLRLPKRPDTYHDIEKAEMETQQHGGGSHPARPSISPVGDWDQMDVVARLRLERHLRGLQEVKWQNARWWRRMNRWMCLVGLVVLVIVIILAVIGTKGRWTS